MATPNALMIFSYEWKLQNVGKDFKTISSKMILFRGEKVFRVALKYSENGQSTLIFLAVYLNKMGLQIADVVCGKEDVGSLCKMNEKKTQRKKEETNFEGRNFQLFTSQVDVANGENFAFLFQIHLEGIVAEYSYCPCDPLAKEQLWSTVSSKLYADVDFIVQDKRFAAHKSILAARSPVFRAEFTKQESKNVNPHQIEIDGVDSSSFEQFLYFVYTGEPMTSLLDNTNLLKLAERYQLKTLENLCRVALLDVNVEQMITMVANLRSSDVKETNCKIRSDISYY